jgi:transposase
MTPRETELSSLLEQCQAALALSLRENQLLREKINLLVRRVFGCSSEKLDAAQLQLLLEANQSIAPAPAQTAELPQAQTPVTRPQRKARVPRLPDNLPVIEEVIDPEPVKAQPEQWRCIGQEVNEQLDYEPGRFLRRRVVRRKYVHRSELDRVPIVAPLPPTLQERCIATAALLAYILVSKYCDHLPLYRLEQIFQRRYGVNLPRQTLARWVELAADWLKPIYEHIQTGVMAGGYVQLDETPINYLEPGAGRALQGYLWTGSRPGGDVFFQWHTSRAATCLDTIVPVDFTGTVQCDGYAAYRAFAKGRAKPIKLAGCWAHVRRKFHEARQTAPRTAGWILRRKRHV